MNINPCYAQLLYNVCSNTSSYTPNSHFETNLDILLPSLSSNAINTGFYNTSVGEYPDQVYGLVLCRGDTTPEDCQDCLEAIIHDVKQLCPNWRGATVWSVLCFLRYSDHRFFSSTEELGTVNYQSPVNITDLDRFLPLMEGFMGNLSFQTAFGPTNTMFAVKKHGFLADTVYGLMQCTRDLSKDECYGCLKAAIKHYERCCYFSRGAMILRVNCLWRIELFPFYQDSGGTQSPSLTSEAGDGSKRTKIVVATVLASLSLPAFGLCFYYIWSRKGKLRERKEKGQPTLLHDLEARNSTNFSCNNIQTGEQVNSQELLPLIDLATLQVATNNFSLENKLGEGGFGPVYKGELPNGKKIAVKRLSTSSVQGSEEFKNEVTLIARLQHKNLVRLLGCCTEREEKMLIYEFMPNSNLDVFLFDPQRQVQLDWSRRLSIINGIARDLLYLHEDSRLKIIHRDLKASNVLLDEEMNPRIFDFGMARILAGNESQAKTSKVVGTFMVGTWLQSMLWQGYFQ